MTGYVLAALLLAALCHASWNAIMGSLKGLEPIAKSALLYLASAICCLPLAIYFGPISAAAMPFLLTSVVTSNLYVIALMYAFRDGYTNQVYPIVRATSVLLTLIIGMEAFGEQVGVSGTVGIVTVMAGVALVSLPTKKMPTADSRAVKLLSSAGFALAAATFLASGLLVDGFGARLSGNVHSYIALKFVLTGAGAILIAVIARGPQVFVAMSKHWRSGGAAGVLSCAVYGIGIWAMSMEAIPKVAVIRDTSILFLALITYFKGEPFPPIRVAATIIVAAGVILIGLR